MGHWVLFDRYGGAVEAVVRPWCREDGGHEECAPIGAVTASCVYVEYLGSTRIREPFDLRSGAVDTCYDPSGLDRGRWRPLPAWVAGALPDAPYSLELVYYER